MANVFCGTNLMTNLERVVAAVGALRSLAAGNADNLERVVQAQGFKILHFFCIFYCIFN